MTAEQEAQLAAAVARTGLTIAAGFVPGLAPAVAFAPAVLDLFQKLYTRFRDDAAAEGVTIEELIERRSHPALTESPEDELNKLRTADQERAAQEGGGGGI